MIPLMISVVTMLPPTIAAVASLIISIRNANKLGDIHLTLNGRLTELLVKSAESARLQGRTEAAATAAVIGKIMLPLPVPDPPSLIDHPYSPTRT
jgi:hypothetical protein